MTNKEKKERERWAKAGVNFMPCDEDSQIYSWQRTNRKASYTTKETISKKNRNPKNMGVIQYDICNGKNTKN
jgi:phage terminase large subunit-like protein